MQWQKRIPPGAWQNITNPNTTYNDCPVNASMQYRVLISNPCFPTVSSNVVSVGLAVPLSSLITGIQGNSCTGNATLYTAAGQANVAYSWTVTGGTPASGTGTSINVTWPGTGGNITLTATNTVTGCTSTSTLQIPACCHKDPGTPNAVELNNRSASSVLSDPSLAHIFP